MNTPRAGTLYLITGWRTRRGDIRERVTFLRWQRPAAERQAQWLNANGYGPAEIHHTHITTWQPARGWPA